MVNNDYQKGRSRGMELGYSIFQKKGIDALKRDIQFRKDTGIDTDVFTDTVDKAADEVKGCTLESVICIVLAVLRDEFDFGHARAKKIYEVWGEYKEKFMKMDIMSWQDEKEKMIDTLNLTQVRFAFTCKKKRNTYEKGRLDGMELALRYLEKGDLQGFKQFFNYRIKQKPSNASLKKQANEVTGQFGNLCYETAIILSVLVLNQTCGFGEKRVQRVMDRWDLKTICMEAGMVTWQEQVDYIIRGELGLDPDVKWMVVRGLLAG